MTFSFFGGLCDDEVATMPLDMRLRGSDGRGNVGGLGVGLFEPGRVRLVGYDTHCWLAALRSSVLG